MTTALELSATDQAAALREGVVHPGALAEESIAAVQRLDPSLNAVVHRLFDKARRTAADLDDRRPTTGEIAPPPFAGVPIMLKDMLCHTRGDPYHAGMRLLRDRAWIATTDTDLARRFRRAGFVIIGRTNVPELASAFTTEPIAYGPTHNPWCLERSACGSSGGSAAAVASGMVAVAHGNDMGGSIRVPASMCGVVGFKPTHGAITLGPEFGDYWAMLAHEGIITRTVRDAAAVVDAVAGPEPGDPDPVLLRPLGAALRGRPRRLRVGIRTRVPLGEEAHPDCAAAVRSVADTLADLGHDVRTHPMSALDDPGVSQPFLDVFAVSIDHDLRRWGERLGVVIGPDDVEPRNWTLALHARQLGATDYAAAIEYLQGYARRVSGALTSCDILVTPTLPGPVPALGFLSASPSPEEVAHLGEFTAPFNVAGNPAISIPAHWSGSGMPVGVQLVGRRGEDDLVLALAAELERSLAWASHHPPTSIWLPDSRG